MTVSFTSDTLHHVKLQLALACGTAAFAALLLGCSVYDSSLVEGAGGGGGMSSAPGGSGPSGPSTGGSGSSTASMGGSSSTGGHCSSADECPGTDTDCATRTCDAGTCGTHFANAGTKIAKQTAGDCSTATCDGTGNVVQEVDDTDSPPDDGNDCTDETCSGGKPEHPPKMSGTTCSMAGGKFCDGMGSCVACLKDEDCPSGVCSLAHSCTASSCGDGMQNGTETDVDCGGSCGPCPPNDKCKVDKDCVGGDCDMTMHCAPTCTDGVKNGTETDIDCGGSCSPCTLGQKCSVAGDCELGACSGGLCVCSGTHVLFSEIRSRGLNPPATTNGSSNEFIELYNPTSSPITFDNTWRIDARSDTAGSYQTRWTGTAAETIPAHGHFLIVGSAYDDAVNRDAVESTSTITDVSSLVLYQGAKVVDAVCYAYSAATAAHFDASYTCEGSVISFNPHDNTTGTNVDASIERKPGGALGNCIDTDDNASDFASLAPSAPQDTASPPTPNP